MSDAVLFEASGRTLDRWEWTEFGLAFMYCLLRGDYAFSDMNAYGANGKIFSDRLRGLRRAAASWFTKHPNQTRESKFDEIAARAEGFALRRNEIAHGLIMDVRTFLFWQHHLDMPPDSSEQFLLVPPPYDMRKQDQQNMPSYGYSVRELDTLYFRIVELEKDIDNFKRLLWPTIWPAISA